jgi:hypothetical protein
MSLAGANLGCNELRGQLVSINQAGIEPKKIIYRNKGIVMRKKCDFNRKGGLYVSVAWPKEKI